MRVAFGLRQRRFAKHTPRIGARVFLKKVAGRCHPRHSNPIRWRRASIPAPFEVLQDHRQPNAETGSLPSHDRNMPAAFFSRSAVSSRSA